MFGRGLVGDMNGGSSGSVNVERCFSRLNVGVDSDGDSSVAQRRHLLFLAVD